MHYFSNLFCSRNLYVLDRFTVQNVQSSLTKQIWEIVHLVGFYCKNRSLPVLVRFQKGACFLSSKTPVKIWGHPKLKVPLLLGVKWPEYEAPHSPSISSRVKNYWSNSSTATYTIMERTETTLYLSQSHCNVEQFTRHKYTITTVHNLWRNLAASLSLQTAIIRSSSTQYCSLHDSNYKENCWIS